MSKYFKTALVLVLPVLAVGCNSMPKYHQDSPQEVKRAPQQVAHANPMPQHLATGEKTIVIDPNIHAWGAYDSSGNLIRSGMASAGANWCPDINRRCRTSSGTFRIQSLGSANCKSTRYPVGKGGAPMPYCMFFNGHQGLHGSYQVANANISHGCVRLHVGDAEWIRFNFANIGTKVIVRSY